MISSRLLSLLLVLSAASCARPAPTPRPAQPPIVDTVLRPLTVCVVREGELAEVTTEYNILNGDSTIGGRPFREVHPADPPAYAANATWMIENEPIPYMRRRYVRYGRVRVIRRESLVRVGEHRGTPLFAAAGRVTPRPEILYVPVASGCVFQVYEDNATVGAVRG